MVDRGIFLFIQDSTNACEHQDKDSVTLYCKGCYGRKHGPKGEGVR